MVPCCELEGKPLERNKYNQIPREPSGDPCPGEQGPGKVSSPEAENGGWLRKPA